MRAFVILLVAGFTALSALSAAAAEEPDLIFKRSTVFKWLTPNDKLATYGLDDPEVEGVACHFTVPERGGLKGWIGVAEEVSDISLACRQIGPIKIKAKFEQGEDVFRKRRSLFFKKMQIVRGCDTKRNVLVYMVYSDRLIEGSPKNSTSTVPIQPWGAGGRRAKMRGLGGKIISPGSIRRSQSRYDGVGAKEIAMSANQPDIAGIQRAVANALHQHWKLYLAEGILLVVLGALAIVLPPLATLAVTILFGWLFLIGGIMGLYTTFMMRQAPGFWWSLISAALAVVVGLLLLVQPLSGALTLTLVLIAFFVVEGVATIMFALDHRRELSGQWGWMLVSGIVDLVLATLVFAGLPSTAAWAIGLLVGINMVFGGSALIAMALHARKIAS